MQLWQSDPCLSAKVWHRVTHNWRQIYKIAWMQTIWSDYGSDHLSWQNNWAFLWNCTHRWWSAQGTGRYLGRPFAWLGCCWWGNTQTYPSCSPRRIGWQRNWHWTVHLQDMQVWNEKWSAWVLFIVAKRTCPCQCRLTGGLCCCN